MKYKIPILLVVLLLAMPQANAFWGFVTKTTYKITKITKSTKALPADEIIRLSKVSDETKGVVKVGKELSKSGLPNDVLEDTFMRIAIHQKKVTRIEAEGMFSRLNGTPGFGTTLRKIIGNNAAGTAGHLNELRIADTASMHGFKVLKIGEKFADGLKKAPTDIDVVLKKGEKYFAIEAKDYASSTKIPMDMFRADMDTLIMYKKNNPNNIIAVFAITNKPDNLRYLEVLKYETEKRGVQLVIGTPEGVIEQVKLLGDII